MKLKKVLMVLFTCVMLLTFSSSASAATGIADTKNTALGLIPSQVFKLFLAEDSADKDWFMWTNNTGVDKFISADVYLNGSRQDFRLGYLLNYGNNIESTIAYNDTSFSGNVISFDYLYVKAGATVYFVLEHAPGKNLSAQYDFVWYIKN
ncbi:hypothetical protein D3C74_298760 [compost metagenome]